MNGLEMYALHHKKYPIVIAWVHIYKYIISSKPGI